MTAVPAPAVWYSVKGSTGDVTDCGICGRTDLRKTVILHAMTADDLLDVIYAGVDCAARVAGNREHEMRQRVANADRARRGLR